MSDHSRRIIAGVVVAFLVTTFVAVELEDHYGSTSASTTSTIYVTGTSETASDTFANYTCPDSGAGVIELLVVSDSSGAQVSGESVNAVNNFVCGSENNEQVVYLNNFVKGQGGWLTPIFPSEATRFGFLNFTVNYQGATYQFSESYAQFGVSCVTLHVPSGNVTSSYLSPPTPSYQTTPLPLCQSQ
jgi:hypothetical protein